MDDVLDQRVIEAFLSQPPEYVVGDDLSWLNEIVQRATGVELDSKTVLANRIEREFKCFRACHATRASDLTSYYRDGLRPLDPARIQERAREIFLSGEFPELCENDLTSAIQAVGTDLRAGHVFFEANERLLIKQAGHYLLYGGEYLVALAAHLGRVQDYRQTLKRFGTPTMFVCDIPIELMSGYTIAEFAGSALEALFEHLLEGDGYERDGWRGAGFPILHPLPAENIVGHFEPSGIRDPFKQYL